MDIPSDSSNIKSEDFNLIRYFLMFGIGASIYVIITFFLNNSTFLDIISLIIPLMFTIFFITSFRLDPSINFNKRIIYLMTLYSLLVLISTVIDYVFPTPTLQMNLTMKMVTDSSNSINNYYILYFIVLIIGICWIFFTYYFTLWFNEKFSGQFGKIKLYYYASLVEIIGTLVEIIGIIQIISLFSEIEKVGYIVSTDTSSYTNYIGIISVGIFLIFLGNIFELIAFIRMYRKISFKQKKPINFPYPTQFTNSQSYITPSSPPFSDNINQSKLEIYCTYCGTKIDSSSEFCFNCGNKIIYR